MLKKYCKTNKLLTLQLISQSNLKHNLEQANKPVKFKIYNKTTTIYVNMCVSFTFIPNEKCFSFWFSRPIHKKLKLYILDSIIRNNLT
jgi:hypothetical protein